MVIVHSGDVVELCQAREDGIFRTLVVFLLLVQALRIIFISRAL